MYGGGGRVELSGSTTANWVAKSANLLVDGLGGPARIGLLLPLHWQAVALLLAGAATGAEVVLAAGPEHLAGCDAVFTTAQHAAAVTADDVLILSGHPFGGPLPPGTPLPPMAQDYGREIPSYGDDFTAPLPATATLLTAPSLTASGPTGPGLTGPVPLSLPAPLLGLRPTDRVLTALALHTADGLAVLLAALGAGASLVLLADELGVTPDADPDTHAAIDRIVAAERVTARAATGDPPLHRVRQPPA